MSDLKEREATSRQLAAGRVDLYKAAVEWVKLAPDGEYTKGRLAREMAAQYGIDEVKLRKTIGDLVRCRALVMQHDPNGRRKRQHLWMGSGDYALARERVRSQTESLVGTTHPHGLPKRPEHRRPRVMRW